MTEQQSDQLYGDAEREQAAGYTPMPPAPAEVEQRAAEDNAVNEQIKHLEQRANDPVERGEPIPIQYNRLDDPTKKVPDKVTISAERAAKELAEYRRGVADIEFALRDQQFNDEVQKLRSPLRDAVNGAKTDAEAAFDANAAYEAAQREALAQQAQPQPVPQADDPVSRALSDPVVLQAINAQRQADLAQGQQAVQEAHAAIQQAAALARASILVHHPELQGLTAEQMPVALSMIQQKDPAKYQAIQHEFEAAQGLLQTAAQSQAQQQQLQAQQQAAQFAAWAQYNDSAFDAELAKEPPQRQAAIKAEALSMLRNTASPIRRLAGFGIQIRRFRSRAGQMVLRDAAAYRLQQKAAQSMRPVHIPTKVVRPGVSGQRAPQEDVDLRNLSNKLNQSHSAKDAASLLAAMRAKRAAR